LREKLEGEEEKSVAVFEGLDFETLINQNYKAYLEVIRNPKVIKLDFLLSDLDLQNLDFSLPVFLKQYNSYFGIIKIQVNAKGISACELIKI